MGWYHRPNRSHPEVCLDVRPRQQELERVGVDSVSSVPLSACSGVSDSATPWTVARQTPLSMGFPRQTGMCCHFFLQGIFPVQGSNTHLLHLQGGSLSPGNPDPGHLWGNTSFHPWPLCAHETRMMDLLVDLTVSEPSWGTSRYSFSLRALVHHHLLHHHFHGDAPGLGHSHPHISSCQAYSLRSSMSHHRKPNWTSSLLHSLFLLTPQISQFRFLSC